MHFFSRGLSQFAPCRKQDSFNLTREGGQSFLALSWKKEERPSFFGANIDVCIFLLIFEEDSPSKTKGFFGVVAQARGVS